ncbi:MAG TPA: response regulator [Burkholderiales bacterium]|jgi:signal transduction histidine kinase/DNA-binding response OmpR family regulator|nr:response regulator [Burkholderiales bacterium]
MNAVHSRIASRETDATVLEGLPAGAPERVNILVVDDLPEKHLVFRSILEELGQNIISAYSGREALRCVLEDEFAVILLDVNMPDMDGFETADLIRKYKKTNQTPIVFVTAYVDEVQAVRGYALGAVDYISAPVVPEILRSKVKVFVDLNLLNRELRQQAQAREALARAEAARGAAEAATRRADLLATASQILSRSLDMEATLAGLLGFAAPGLADCAMVAIQDDRGQLARVKLAEECGAPPPAGVVEGAIEPVDLGETVGRALTLRETLRLSGPLRFQGLPGETPALQPVYEVVVFPMYVGERAFGALLLGVCMPRSFDTAEMALAKEVVSRAVIALENASLYAAIQDADRRKNEFLAMLAHELRNPLAPIRNAVHVLQRGGATEKNVTWSAEVIGRQVDHLATLVDDLLDVSRIARGKVVVSRDPLRLSEVIDHAVETSRPMLEKRRHHLVVQMPREEVAFSGDLVRLAQVLSNLLNNAAKFTPAGGHITLDAAAVDGVLRISVRDNGMGIDPQLLPHVFDLFTQGDQTLDRSEGGLGIGLTLVKHLVELHGGRIEALSAGRGQGAEFVMFLPEVSVAPAAAPEAVVRHAEISARDLLRVMVVDDVAASSESLCKLLELEGHRVAVAGDGLGALELASTFRPDVIVLDIGLPGKNGFEVAAELRAGGAFADTLLVALSGYGGSEDRERGARAGFNHYLVKPADIPTLLSIIGAHAALKHISERSLSGGMRP